MNSQKPAESISEIEKIIRERFGPVEIRRGPRGPLFVRIGPKKVLQFLFYCKNMLSFSQLTFLTAVDYPEEKEFLLTYMLTDKENKTNLCLQTAIDRLKPEMESIHTLWDHAWTYQRELKELFGIDFPGSPRVDENFVLEGWREIPPMRRDFDTIAYSKQTFFPREGRLTKTPKTYMRDTLYPEWKQNAGSSQDNEEIGP